VSTARDKRIADEFLGDHLPCGCCGFRTDRETLSRYGARCDSCYSVWLREVPADPRPMTPQVRAEIVGRLRQLTQPVHPKAWAHRLQQREQRGEQLSMASRHAWREALGLPREASANPDEVIL